MLGSNTGSVHKQRQGTGLATVLGDSLAVKDFIHRDDAEAAGRAQAAAAKKQAADAAAKDIKDFNPERWIRHEREIKDGLNMWIDEGAKLMQKGINPNSSVTDEAVAWRKQRATIEAKSKASMQMKQMFEATRGKIDGSEPDKYSQDTLTNMKSYFESPLDDIISGAVLPPAMLQAKPSMNLQKTWVGLSKDLYDRNGNKPLDEAGKWDFVRASMSNDPDIMEAAGSYMAQLPQDELDRYKQRAQSTGKSVVELVNYDFLERYSPGREPFDLNKYIQTAADSIDVSEVAYSDPNRFSSSTDKKLLEKNATTKAQVALTNPDAIVAYQSLLPMKDGETEGEYRARAVPHLSKTIQSLKAQDRKSGLTDKGGEAKDMTVSAEEWLRHIKSPDRSLNERASRFLFETKGVLGNMNVSSATVDPEMKYDDQLKRPAATLVINLQGSPSLKDVEEQITSSTDLKKEDIRFESVGTSSIIRIPITDDTENALLRLHDKAFKTGHRKYQGAPLQWNADDILKQAKPASGTKPKYNG